ncbi:MAG: prenyltransferase/squalene oxidase repeat-containing protein [Chloroflexota bacterium]
MGERWLEALKGDPLPWLLEESNPAVRHAALRLLLDRPDFDPEVIQARKAAMETEPIAAILAAQHPRGYWVKPGPGYGPKYTGTVWQVIFLDQLGADGNHPQVKKACEYVLSYCLTESGGFGCSARAEEKTPPPSVVIHCLHGNLLRALLGFGWLDDERVQRAIDWQANSITGERDIRYYKSSTPGPGFKCAANDKNPCAWGAVKALLALARVPEERREPHVQRAIQRGVEFLLSHDPAGADYPMGYGNQKPNGSWFKPGFPLGYVADVLQILDALCELGQAREPRLQAAIQWLLSLQDDQGRWKNQHAYNGKTWVDFEKQGQPSKWVTLRACRVLKCALGSD